MKEIRLQAFMARDEVILYDIYVQGKWIGSRRTFNACAMFLGLKPEHLIRVAELT